MRLKFRNPPLDELVIGAYFPPIQRLQSQHVGRFWGLLQKSFPKCTQQPFIGELIPSEDELFPMPRFWLISEDEAHLIQIQKTAFIANWRRRTEAAEYPHYENVKLFFEQNLRRFSDFLRSIDSEGICQVSHLEMAYINFLTLPNTAGFHDLSSLVPGISSLRIPRDLGQIEGYSAAYSINISPDLMLMINLHQAKRIRDEQPGLKLEIRARGIPDPPELSAAALWFDKAHDYIGKLFLKLTSRSLQRVWGPVKGSLG